MMTKGLVVSFLKGLGKKNGKTPRFPHINKYLKEGTAA